MATYRYLFADLLSNVITGELPVRLAIFQTRLNAAGKADFTGSIPLSHPQVVAQDVENITAPRRTALYVDRDGTLVWGGIVWTRRYASSENGQLEIKASTFDSYAYHRWIEGVIPMPDLSDQPQPAGLPQVTFVQVDQLLMAQQLVALMQGTGAGGMPGGIGIQLGGETCGVLRDRQWFGYEQKGYGEALQQLSEVENGFDYLIDVRYDDNDQPAKYLRLGYPQLGRWWGAPTLTFEYPGNVLSYVWPEDGSSGANDYAEVGIGEGSAMLRSRATTMEPGYPLYQLTGSYKDVKEQWTLDAHAAEDLRLAYGDVVVPEMTVRADIEPVLGEYWPGDSVRVRITDYRFPAGSEGEPGLDTTCRLLGHTTKIDDADLESVDLILSEPLT